MVQGRKSYSQAATPPPSGSAPEYEVSYSGESSSRDVMLSNQQEDISALKDMVKGLSAQLFDLRNLHQPGLNAAPVPEDKHLPLSPAGGRRPLPGLSQMTKGLSADSHFSGKSDQEGTWDEFCSRIKPSLRHPSLALLLSASTPLQEVREDKHYLEEANELFYDFLCRVTTGTANAIVRSYEEHSDGHGAWRELAQLRHNTSAVYFITQVDRLLSLTNQLSRLAPPLSTFLESKETLRRLREYSANTRVTPSGKPLCMETVETIFSAMAIVRLHPDYMLLKSKFMSETMPTASVLSAHVTSHYDTILAPRAVETRCAFAVNHTGDNFESEVAVKVPCPVCHRRGHSAKDCFIKNVEKREAFFKTASPTTKAAILKRVADYEKNGSLPKPSEHLGAAAGKSELYPGLYEAGEVLFAIREASTSDLHPGLDETGEDIYASDYGSGLLESGCDSISGSLTSCPALGQLSTYQDSELVEFSLCEFLEDEHSALSSGSGESVISHTAGEAEQHSGNLSISGSLPSSSTLCEHWICGRGSVPVESQPYEFPVFNYYSVLTEVGEPEVVISHTAGEEEKHSGTGETLFALCGSGQSDLYPGLEDTGKALFALGEGGQSGKSAFVDPPSSGLALSDNYSVLDRVLAVPTDDTARCAKVAGGVVDPDLRVAPRSTMDKSAVLDCGATKHIFDSMKVFTEDDDGDHFGDNFDDSIPDLDSGSDSHEDDDPEACQVGLSGDPELYPGLRVDILTTYPVMVK
ncbi:hypothetical protein CYMTET_15757 [Cymbomonas tetramitiformis]|uniref:Uncharacterized protein n=1 Tax=Cymbomonas tetramitiformis TaxID=36881 RepID=A0AAE0GEV9_9CHLO|nr:hypothetical protein CYMTET_15757 [Cymbomonas tetramitiformis]